MHSNHLPVKISGNRLKLFTMILLVSFFTGCMSFVSAFSSDPKTPRIYGGVRGDVNGLMGFDTSYYKSAGPLRILLILDIPFSLVLDTLFLPITIPKAISERGVIKKQAEGNRNLVGAVARGDLAETRRLVESGVDPNIGISPDGNTLYNFDELTSSTNIISVLYIAYDKGHAAVAGWLVKNKTTIWPAMRMAIKNSNKQILSAMLGDGISSTDIFREAVSADNHPIVSFALGKGADVNAKVSEGDPALILAVRNENTNLLNELLKSRKLNINYQNDTGQTALHLAVAQKNRELVRMLIRAGINQNLNDRWGKTARERVMLIKDETVKAGILAEF